MKGEDTDEFDWHHDPNVVIKPVQALAVYKNDFGDVVVRQARMQFQDEDPYIVIPKEHLIAVIDGLTRAASGG